MAGFLTHQTLGRPQVTLKLATSLDGCIALASGESRWITGAEARSEEHTSELQSLMRISYAVFCVKKKKEHIKIRHKKTQYQKTHTKQPPYKEHTEQTNEEKKK